MKFNQYEDGSGEIKYSWKERIIILFKGKLILDALNMRHLGNHLMKIVMMWQTQFNDELKNTNTFEDTEVKTK